MEHPNCLLSPVSRGRLTTQGYGAYTDKELSDFRFGIRFAYIMCAAVVLTGLLLTSIPILVVAMVIAFFGAMPPYHPFDYLYNYVIRHWFNKPKLPHRTNQGRFACGIATVWLGMVIALFYNGYTLGGYIAGGILISVASLVSSTDICIPSMIYNALFKKKQASQGS